jgi:hypothetical protein
MFNGIEIVSHSCCVALLSYASISHAFDSGPGTAHQSDVNSGAIVVRDIPNPGKHGVTVEAVGIMRGTLDEVSAVLGDYLTYPAFMPNVGNTAVFSDNGDEKTVDYTLKLPLGKQKQYRLKLTTTRSSQLVRIDWKKQDRPDLKPADTIAATEGYWELRNYPDKDGYVLARYHVYTDPGDIPFGLGWIVDMLTRSSVPDVLKNTRSRVEQLYYAKKPGH